MKMIKFGALALAASILVGCGEAVEVPPAHVGKIMTKSGYQETLIPTSKFRLEPCVAYCDRLVLLDASDKTYTENLTIFIPEDKLNLDVVVRTTLSINPRKTEELFASLSPQQQSNYVSVIDSATVYKTYAAQIVQAQVREYLSKFSIGEIASSNEKINADLRNNISKVIEERTPFSVRFVGVTDIRYPKIITAAQEAAAERREAIQQEDAQLQISKVRLERELQEARLQRAIEKERAETEAMAQRTLAESVDPRVLKLRELEIRKIEAEKWDGRLPTTIMGGEGKPLPVFHMNK